MKFLILIILTACASAPSVNNSRAEEPTVTNEEATIDLTLYKEKSKNYKPRVIQDEVEEHVSDEEEAELVSLISQLQSEEERNFFDLGRKAPPPARFFILPVKGRISSNYGMRKGKMHHGIDIPGRIGSEIRASNHGKVVFSGSKGGYGQVVIISHLPDLFTVYAHNSKNLVKPGFIVKKGDIISLMGSTGRSTGSHVHFEIRKRTKSMDPIKFIQDQEK